MMCRLCVNYVITMWEIRSHSLPHNYPHSRHDEHRMAHKNHSVVCIKLCVNTVFIVLPQIDTCKPQCGMYLTMCKHCVYGLSTE